MILSGSTLFGTTYYGGASGVGTVFSLSTSGGSPTILHSFASSSDGRNPYGSLALAGSTLYGTTYLGGSANNGTIFKVDTNGGNYSVLLQFASGGAQGAEPYYGPLTVVGSTIYGMARDGSGGSGKGTIFKLNTDGTNFTVLHTFAGGSGDGQTPYGSLTLIGSSLYGMTSAGGASSGGTVFKIDTDGSNFALLHSFAGGSSDGIKPDDSLTWDGAATFYGTTYNGGASNGGTLFAMAIDGSSFSLLNSFTGTPDGSSPNGTLLISGSMLYGTTYLGGTGSNGTIFSFAPIPEPGTYALLAGLGGLGLALYRRRPA